MPPLLSQTALAAPSAPVVHSNAPPASQYPLWSNPVPSQFTELDRLHALQSDNDKILEMHPDGLRGVSHITQYCVLIIYINNITTLANTSRTQGASHLADWNRGHSNGRLVETRPTKVIRNNVTGKFLCMDNESVVFQQDAYDPRYCEFHHDYDRNQFRDRYYRQSNPNKTHSSRWYLGINKDGSIRCGNVTRQKQQGANFYRLEINVRTSESPPFEGLKRKCCAKNKCKRRHRRPKKPSKGTSTDSVHDNKNKRCYRTWCRRHRRKFFQLKLKNVKRYYNRCIVKKKHNRRCRTR